MSEKDFMCLPSPSAPQESSMAVEASRYVAPPKKRTWSKKQRAAFNARQREKRKQEAAAYRAYREEWKGKFSFMFVEVKDEADAMGFLNAVILPDFRDWGQSVTPGELWSIIQEWSHHRRLTARMKRIVQGACEQWNAKAAKHREAA